jgi:hypothetical protein
MVSYVAASCLQDYFTKAPHPIACVPSIGTYQTMKVQEMILDVNDALV